MNSILVLQAILEMLTQLITPVFLLVMSGVASNAASIPQRNFRTLRLLDGNTTTVNLPPGVEFVPLNETELLSFHPGEANVQCTEAYSDKWKDKTSDMSPFIEDCIYIKEVEELTENQGYFRALAGGDIKPNGDWCRLMIHGSCVFGIRTHAMFGADVGTLDIRDAVQGALDRNPLDRGRIQWEGYFECDDWSHFSHASSTDFAIFWNT
ncbi:hypothetical protein F4780DRAFT_781061 [Xylariomycetidae sp. FL0641]|nr:hypothetical protein F4780DRAFT_781061 [Xylariomycetidae sp. FL0641]